MSHLKRISQLINESFSRAKDWIFNRKLFFLIIFTALVGLVILSLYLRKGSQTNYDNAFTNDQELFEATAKSLEIAKSAEESNNFLQAIEEYEKSLPGLTAEERPGIEYKLGELYSYLGDFESSIHNFNNAESSYTAINQEENATKSKIQKEIAESRKFAEEFSSNEDGP